MTTTLFVVALVILTALVFDFTNGFHDSANAMATSVATGALRPRTAVVIAAVLNVVGAFLSTEVAKTISGGIVNDAVVTPVMIFAGLVGASLWNLTTWLFGMPSSSSHALFGGLIGAVLVGAGTAGVNFSVIVSKIVLPALMAASRSALMPSESVSSAMPALRIDSKSACARRNSSRCEPKSGAGSGIAMSPRSRSCGKAATARASGSASSGVTPDLLAPPSTLT